MPEHSLWALAPAFRDALENRSTEHIAALLDDDIDWAIFGPIDMFPFLGARQGKEAVIEVLTRIADNFRLNKFDREITVLAEDSASTLVKCSFTANDNDKPISLRVANFFRFNEGRLAKMRTLMDTFDLVEQVLGHPINLPQAC
jgi:ketosteroid isomerase-like protein